MRGKTKFTGASAVLAVGFTAALACGGPARREEPAAPLSVSVAQADTAPTFTAAAADFPSNWEPLPDAPSERTADAIARARSLSGVSVTDYRVTHFTTDPNDANAEFVAPIWLTRSASDAQRLADALVRDMRGGFVNGGTFVVVANGVARLSVEHAREFIAHLRGKGVLIGTELWPFVTAEAGAFPTAWGSATTQDREANASDNERFGRDVTSVEGRSFGSGAAAFQLTFFGFPSLADARAAATAARSSASADDAVWVGPHRVVVGPTAKLTELAELYRQHNLALEPAPTE